MLTVVGVHISHNQHKKQHLHREINMFVVVLGIIVAVKAEMYADVTLW